MAKTPLVTLGGVDITEQDFWWDTPAGVFPHEQFIVVPVGEINDAIKNLVNPVDMQLEVEGGMGEFKKERQIFKRIFIHEPRPMSDFEVQWKISDARYELYGKKLSFAYNVTRITNQKQLLNSNTAENDPAALRKFFDTFSAGRWLSWSVQPSGKVWSVGQIVELEMKKLKIPFDRTGATALKGDYVIENLRMDGEDVYAALEFLLSKARLQLGIRTNGTIYVFSIDAFEEGKYKFLEQISTQEKTGPGKIYKQDLSRIRPRQCKIRFQRKEEVYVKLGEANEDHQYTNQKRREVSVSAGGKITADMINRRQAIGCVNVIQVPIAITIAGRKYNIGEYAPIKEFIDAVGISDEDVRAKWWLNLLEVELSKRLQANSNIDITDRPEPLAVMICAAIRQHYRQFFMIDPVVFDFIEQWEARRVSVVDNYSRFRPPSPLWADFALVPKVRSLDLAFGRGLNSLGMVNYFVADNDPSRERPTVGTVVMVDHDLGIFRVEYPHVAISGSVDEIIPSCVLNPPDLRLNANIIGRKAFTIDPERTHLHPSFVMETIISVSWLADRDGMVNSAKRYFDIDFNFGTADPTFGKCLGPPVEILSTKEFARVDLDGNVVNRGILDAIASVEKNITMFSFKDRFVGYTTIPGFRAEEIGVDGNIKSLMTSLSPSEGAETTIDMLEVPSTPTLEQTLPYQAREFLYRQVNRGGI